MIGFFVGGAFGVAVHFFGRWAKLNLCQEAVILLLIILAMNWGIYVGSP